LLIALPWQEASVDLDAHPYRCFVAVADERSFTRAAARLNTSQPALSGQIRELERRLGFALFTRTSRSVELTSEGRLLMANARRFVSETDIINRAARDIRSNELRLGAALQTELIAERNRLVEDFMRGNGDVPLQIVNDQRLRLLRSLSRREIDIAISIEPLASGRAGRSSSVITDERDGGIVLEQLVLSERPIELVLPGDHPLTDSERSLTELRGLPVAVPNRIHGVPLIDAITARLTQLGATLVRPPEGHAIAVERYGRFRRIAAIRLNWFEPPFDPGDTDPAAAAPRPARDLGLSTGLVLIRHPGDQRPAAERFWRHAMLSRDMPATA
jgi:DNA-binding transcriptional LysR family regulator